MIEFIKKQLSHQSKTIYHTYGLFAVEFEQLTLSIRLCIFTLLKGKGLSDFEYLRVLLHDQTAYPLLMKLRALMALKYKNEKEQLKLIEKLFINTNTLIEKRNFIIHGNVFKHSLGGDEIGIELLKDKATKAGIIVEEEIFNNDSLIDLTSKVVYAKYSFDRLNICLMDVEKDLKAIFAEFNFDDLKI